jgi:ubiquinone/menaquinone biosynthesis C-methylase UbiE
MDETLKRESDCLIRSWMRHDQDWLRDYLVGSVEDPRLNVQSVLTRHFLVEHLVGQQLAELMEAELRFAISMNWIVRQVETGLSAEEFGLVLHGLKVGADNVEGQEIPGYLLDTFNALPLEVGAVVAPNYLQEALGMLSTERAAPLHQSPVLDTFVALWREALQDRTPFGLSVLEAACGSANDYRAINACGLGRLIDYRGFDLCEKNVANARAMFPEATFSVGNAFSIDVADRSVDVAFVHDLFEHLSLEGIQAAVNELCRVTRAGISLGFFSMHEQPETVITPTEEYHWNALSAPRMRELFEAQGFQVQILSIDAFLTRQFECSETHNAHAYTFRCERARA